MSLFPRKHSRSNSLRLYPEVGERPDDVDSSSTEDLEPVKVAEYRRRFRHVPDNKYPSLSYINMTSTNLHACCSTDGRCPDISPLSSMETEWFSNPLQVHSMRSGRARSRFLRESLKYHGVELIVECVDLDGTERRWHSSKCFVVLFCEGMLHGTWEKVDSSEDEKVVQSIRFMKKFPMRAATAMDREEKFLIAVFDSSCSMSTLDLSKALGKTEFTVSEIMDASQMILDKDLAPTVKHAIMRPQVILALEMVYHLEHAQDVTFDIGFLESAPVRNRMFFLISRGIGRGKWVPIYRSEVRVRSDLERFDAVTLGAQEFHCGDMSRLFRIEVYRSYRNGRTKLLGFIQTSCEKISSMEIGEHLNWWPGRDGIFSAEMLIQYREERGTELWYSLRLAGCP